MNDANWILRCNGLSSHAHSMGLICEPRMAQLMGKVTQRFISLTSPEDDTLRNAQHNYVYSAIGAISHADGMGKIHKRSDELYELCRRLFDKPLPETVGECERSTLSETGFLSEVAGICSGQGLR